MKRIRSFHLIFWFLIELVIISGPLSAEDILVIDKKPAAVRFSDLFTLYGSASTTYAFRTIRDSEGPVYDNDLFQNLTLSLSFPSNNMFAFNFLGSLKEDLDGNNENSGFYYFEDLGDTVTSPLYWYLYEANVDVNYPLPFLRKIRFGRQAGDRGEPVYFDGLTLETEWFQRLIVSCYGGFARHAFEVNSQWVSDKLAGAGVDFFPFKNGAISLDYLFVQDEKNSDPNLHYINHLLTFSTKFFSFNFLKTSAEAKLLNWGAHNVSLKAVATFPGIDLELLAAYFIKLDTLNDLTIEFSPYDELFGDSLPFHSFDAKVRKLFGRYAAVDLGVFFRRLLDIQNIDMFNRKFSKYYAVVSLHDLFFQGFFFSLSGDIWINENKKDYSLGFEAGYGSPKFLEGSMIRIGADYSSYVYDYYPESDLRETIPAFFVKLKIPIGQHFSMNGSYELETSLGPNDMYHDLDLGIHYEF